MVDLIDVVAVACEKVELIEGATPRFVSCRDENHARAELEELMLQAERMESMARQRKERTTRPRRDGTEYEWELETYQVGRYGFILVNYEGRWSLDVRVGLTKEGTRRFFFGETDDGG